MASLNPNEGYSIPQGDGAQDRIDGYVENSGDLFSNFVRDTNNDGIITEAEAEAFVANADTDGDGEVSLAEISAASDPVEAVSNTTNEASGVAHGDGALTATELAGMRASESVAAEAADTNGDGVVDESEAVAFVQARDVDGDGILEIAGVEAAPVITSAILGADDENIPPAEAEPSQHAPSDTCSEFRNNTKTFEISERF